MNGRDILKELSFIDPGYIEAAAPLSVERGNDGFKHKFFLIAAIAATLLLLTGAAAYTKWSSSLEAQYRLSEDTKKQAEQSGLSVTYPLETAQVDSGLSVTDQGITVSVKQTLIDAWSAQIVLSIQGFELPDGAYPYAEIDQTTFDGGEFHGYGMNHEFYDGILVKDDGTYVYVDGASPEKGHYTDSDVEEDHFYKGRYNLPDGSMELTLTYRFAETDGSMLGRNLELHITGFGQTTPRGRAWLDNDVLVSGNLDLSIPLNGTMETITKTPNYSLPSGDITLVTATIGPMSGGLDFRLDSPLKGVDTPENLAATEEMESRVPRIDAVRLKDGTDIPVWDTDLGYREEENCFHMNFRISENFIDLSQVSALVFYDRMMWSGKPEDFIIVPID